MFSLPPPKESAEFTIRKIVTEDTGNFYITDHARLRMLERGITDRQIHLCISKGAMVRGPEFDRKNESGWTCTFRRQCAGSVLRAGCKLIQRQEGIVLVLTAFWEK